MIDYFFKIDHKYRELKEKKKKTQILVVEDEQIVAADIKMSLIRLGYDVCGIAVSGKEAIKKAAEIRPDLVLMDIVLEGKMDGIEAAEIIRSRLNIPIIYLTAHADNKTIERAKITEPFGYIVKPFEDRELKSIIEIAIYKNKIGNMLKESEAFNFALFQYNPIETIVVDREGRVAKSNLAKRKSGGKLPNIGDVMYKNYAGKHETDMHAELMECIASSKKKEFPELKYGDKYLNISIAPFPNGAIITSQDITERKRAEEEKEKLQAQLIHSEKMAGIGTLASGIAHEFNNLLQIMRGYTEFAQKTKRQKDIEEALDIVIHNADRATKIIKDLLTFSRHEVSGKEQSDIIEPIESVLSLTEDQLRKHNIEVIREYRIIPPIRINKTELQQVFLNMVTNARDAMLPKGGILKIDVSQNSENVEIRFCDSGRGIAQENLGKIFEPFFTTKGAAGADSELQGTGLGLSVSYGIVKKHGGTIEVESKTGSGTTFTIKLPAKEE